MRTIEATPTFKEDLKRVCQDPGRKRTVEDLLSILARDLEFMVGMPAHTLPGKWSDYLECQLQSNLSLSIENLTKTDFSSYDSGVVPTLNAGTTSMTSDSLYLAGIRKSLPDFSNPTMQLQGDRL